MTHPKKLAQQQLGTQKKGTSGFPPEYPPCLPGCRAHQLLLDLFHAGCQTTQLRFQGITSMGKNHGSVHSREQVMYG